MISIKLKDYTKYPSCRYKKHGEYSGEWFRDDILIPLLNKYHKSDKIVFIGNHEYVKKAKKFMKNMEGWQSGNAADC